jgi:tetratricopeptide (TPR) repeat protein
MAGRSTPAALAVLIACTLAPAGLGAQEEHHHGAPPERLGSVSFRTSCGADAQRHFERGLALLHSFWFDEGERAFRAAAAADSGCAIAYWGVAMTQLGNPLVGVVAPARAAAGLAAAERGLALAPRTPRERAYVEAAAALYRGHDSVPLRPRMLAYEEAMRRAHEQSPDDDEAAIFYALALIANAPPTDTTFARQKRAAELLVPRFRRFPQHPGLAHYIIHAYDSPRLAHLAEDAARRYAQIAPAAPHAQHMPSHIFTRLGMWDESIASNTASAAAMLREEDTTSTRRIAGERLHAYDYMTYAYLQEGRGTEARRLVELVARVPFEEQPRSALHGAGALGTAFGLAAIPARHALEQGRWSEAAALRVRPSSGFPFTEGITHFARAIGLARSGGDPGADLAALASIRDTMAARKDSAWAKRVEAQRLAASAVAAHARGDTAAALRLAMQGAELEEAVEKHPVTPGHILPARELLGELLLEMGRPADALRAFEQTLARSPRRARALFGAARAAELTGNAKVARARYEELAALMSRADPDRPELAAARRYLATR